MYNLKEVEQEILKFWKGKNIFAKLMKKNKGKKHWSFIDGPITANNPMGVHHAWGRAYKDLYQRFKAMQGFDQRFQNGFDCQGLWLEVETEKSLGFNSRKDIENFGLDKFSKECRKRVEKFSKVQTKQSIKLGQWMDWPNSYYTMSDKNIEYIWYFLKKCHEKKWLYKGTKILPWCIRCGTSSSQHEMSDAGYSDLTHKSLYVKFKIKGKKEFLLAWTTTEFTLSSNVALAVNPKLDYAKVQVDNNILYLSEKTIHKLGKEHKVLEKLKGRKLVGLEYESIYPELEVQKDVRHRVVAWDEVGEEEGTGIVHIAPTCGQEDYELGKKEKLKLIDPALDEEGNFNEKFGFLTGRNVMEVKQEIRDDLEKKSVLYKIEDYAHRYPVCWRCQTELVFRIGSEWFISCEKIRPLMKKAVSKVKWHPEHIGKLMLDWLDNMGDWNISRKRYWGLPLMFYECKCGNTEVLGSLKELRQKSVNKKDVDSLPELHRPWIDKIKIKCGKCNEVVERIKEVGDCWLDAGIVPFSTLKYFEDKKYWKKWFPAELIIEMRAQVRLWFYAQLFMSITLENKSPYESVFAYERVVDEKGEEMHKSKGNAIWFDDAVENMGVDVMRWLYCSQNPKIALKFGYGPAKEAKRQLTVLWNLGNYVKLTCRNVPKNVKNLNVEDRWILSRLENTKKKVTETLDNIHPNLAIREIEEFLINNLSRQYGQLIRERLNEKNVQFVLYNCFIEGLKLLGPFLPFISEKLYLNICKKKESLFLENWPKADSKRIDKKLEEDMSLVQQIIQEALSQREKTRFGVRWPLPSLTVTAEKDLKKFSSVIMNQVNVKNVNFRRGKLSVKLDSKITKELELEGFAREIMRRIQALRKKAGLQKNNLISLSINSDLDLSRFKKEIQEKVGAKTLEFREGSGKNKSKEKIKDKEFLISFDFQ